MDEKNNTQQISAPEWLSTEKRIFLQQIEPVIKHAIFRGVLLAGLVFLGIGIVIGFIYAAISAH